jgi:hypothetical protein
MIKPVRMDVTVGVVWPEDPAIDQSHKIQHRGEERHSAEVYRDAATGGSPMAWRDCLRMVEGMQPTVFVIGAIPPGELTAIQDECGMHAVDDSGAPDRSRRRYFVYLWRMFAASLRGIENGPPEPRMIKHGGVTRVDPSWIESHCGGDYRAAGLFVGHVAAAWGEFSERDEKN